MKHYNTDDYPKAETYSGATSGPTEFPNVVAGQWVISHGMFSLPFKPTCDGFLWQVVEVLPRGSKYSYLSARLRCAGTQEVSTLKLSMLYVLPDAPDAELITEYTKALNEWLNRP